MGSKLLFTQLYTFQSPQRHNIFLLQRRDVFKDKILYTCYAARSTVCFLPKQSCPYFQLVHASDVWQWIESCMLSPRIMLIPTIVCLFVDLITTTPIAPHDRASIPFMSMFSTVLLHTLYHIMYGMCQAILYTE